MPPGQLARKIVSEGPVSHVMSNPIFFHARLRYLGASFVGDDRHYWAVKPATSCCLHF